MKFSAGRLSLILSMVTTLAAGWQTCAGAEAPRGAVAEPKEVALSGQVSETMDGGGYTYVLLRSGSEKLWVAIPLTKVTVGRQLSLLPGFEMKNFTSKGLNRKFDRLIFSAGVANSEVKLSPAAIKMVHQGVPMPAPQKAAPQKSEKPRLSIEQVPKAKGPNSYSIAQLYAKKTKLQKKPVVVRGRVVKVSPRILKRNWVHIQDGSGSEAKKNNNLVITTRELPKEGELVTVKGTVYNNLDFGSGYKYSLLVEGGRFSRK